MILFKANGRCAAAVSDEKITSGSVGIEVTFQLSEVYDDLAALAVFRGSGAEVSVILPEPVCTVPPEVLAEPGGNLLIGVYARDGEGTIAVPTVWAKVGPILGGATPDLPDTPATPDWTAQVELALAEAVEKSEEALEKASAVEEEGARQVQAVQDAGTEALDAIETGKTAATEAVEAAQTTAVQTVQTESSTQQAAVQAKGEQTIASIPADYTALSGKVDNLNHALFAENAVDSADLTSLRRSIAPGNTWTALGGATAGYIEIPSNAEKIVITPSTASTNVWAFLKSIGTPTQGETPDFSASYPARISDSTATPHTYVVEPDMHFLYVLQTNTNSVDVFPSSVYIYTVQLIDDTLSVPGKAADAKATGDAIAAEASAREASVNALTSQADALSKSNGQIYEIPIICYNDGPRYIVLEGNIVESEEGDLWTDYIECPKYLLVDMEDDTVRLMIYFYDKVADNYIPRWDLLDTTAPSGAKNYLNLNICRNRAIAIPDGVYMRVSKAVEGDVKLYGWSGAHVGCELAGQSLSYNSESNTWKPYGTKDGITFMVIPGNAELWFSKNAALVELFGTKDGNRVTIVDSTRNNAFTQCLRLPKGYDYFYASVVLDYYISATQTGKGSLVHNQKLSDLNDYVSLLMHYDECAIPVGRGRTVIDWAKYIAEIEWTSKRNKITAQVGTVYGTFKKNYKYTGIPYTSAWERPSFFGWHVSRHTFMNAANDSRSEFYEKSDRRGGSMGYGLVCSSYASLASGWEYPQTCAGFSMDPNVVMGYDYQPNPGNIYAVSGHSLIPETNGKGTGFESYTLYEQSAPATKRKVHFSFIGGDNSRSYSYINHYFKKFTNVKSHDNPTAYDIENYQITNGSARPFRGDRCVFTSAESNGVRINIRVNNATTLYYQECTYDPTTAVFTPVGAIMQKAIDAYASEPTSVNIDESTLGDGKFYCVYTDVDSTKEYFEYHVVNTETWGKTDNNINFSRNDFWYAMWWKTSETETEDENVATVCLPANADGDYTEFRKLCNPSAAASCKMFFKGVLGAYCTTVEYVG